MVGDRSSFEGFYRANAARIVRACALVTLDVRTAEDVAAEAFTQLWSHWDRIQDDDHAGGYVFKTAMRLCARRGRALRRERPATAEPTVDPHDEAVLTRRELEAALAALPLRQRQAVVLRDWAALPTSEVAELLSMKESTVRVHLARGRERLRDLLGVQERE
jgi:RNA polymerase sigma factor (sigma-70 family)